MNIQLTISSTFMIETSMTTIHDLVLQTFEYFVPPVCPSSTSIGPNLICQLFHMICLNLVKIMALALMIIQYFSAIYVHVQLVSTVQNVNMILDFVNQILVGIIVYLTEKKNNG